MRVRAYISVPYTGSGQGVRWEVPDYSVDELRAEGWTIEAAYEARDLDGEPVLLTWFELTPPGGEPILSGGTSERAESVLERLRREANRRLAGLIGVDDPYRPSVHDVPGVLGAGAQTALPADAEMPPDPNIAIVEVLCEDETVVDALEAAGAVVWYVQEESDDVQ